MRKILHNSNITIDDKLKLYNQTLNEFIIASEKVKTSQKFSYDIAIPNPSLKIEQPEIKHEPEQNDILFSIPNSPPATILKTPLANILKTPRKKKNIIAQTPKGPKKGTKTRESLVKNQLNNYRHLIVDLNKSGIDRNKTRALTKEQNDPLNDLLNMNIPLVPSAKQRKKRKLDENILNITKNYFKK